MSCARDALLAAEDDAFFAVAEDEPCVDFADEEGAVAGLAAGVAEGVEGAEGAAEAGVLGPSAIAATVTTKASGRTRRRRGPMWGAFPLQQARVKFAVVQRFNQIVFVGSRCADVGA